MSFSARAGTSFHREGSEEERPNQNDFGLGLVWNQRVTEYFQSTLNFNVSRNFTRETLSELGLIAPDLTADTASASWTTQYQSGPRTSLSTSLSYRFYDIADARAIPGAQIVVTEQPFVDILSIPLLDDDGGPLPIRDAEQDILSRFWPRKASTEEPIAVKTRPPTLGSIISSPNVRRLVSRLQPDIVAFNEASKVRALRQWAGYTCSARSERRAR